MNTSLTCPECGSPQRRPPTKAIENGAVREYPTQYTCGTVNHPEWDRPIWGKECYLLAGYVQPE